VFKSERASSRYSARASTNERASLSRQFFQQSMVYLAAFYLTWPAYLALQIMVAYGIAYSNYGLYLFAGTAVTLQGFWNFVFHSGLQLSQVRKRVSSALLGARNLTSRRDFGLSQSSASPPRRSSRSTRRSGEISSVTEQSRNSTIVSDQ